MRLTVSCGRDSIRRHGQVRVDGMMGGARAGSGHRQHRPLPRAPDRGGAPPRGWGWDAGEQKHGAAK